MKLRVTRWKEKEGSKLEAEGLIRRNSNKPEYGSLMLTSTSIAVTNGYMNSKTRIGFITAKVEELERVIEDNKLKEGSDFSALVAPHRIVILEKTASEMTDDDQGYIEKINPSTGEVLTKDGEVIYRKTAVVEEGSDVVDVLITHDKEPAVDEANKEFATKEHVVAKL